MAIDCASRSETGPVRKKNEDSFLALPEAGLFAVCDGMGGHRGGQTASRTAARQLADFLTGAQRTTSERGVPPDESDDLERLVEAAVLSAHERILDTARSHPDLAGMGTTCTMTLVAPDRRVVMGHVGDSRLYLLRDDRVRQVSEDHSLVNELLKSGTITASEAIDHPQSNIITQALGVTPTPRVELRTTATRPGDTFLLCSDGLSHYYPDPADLAAAMRHDDLQRGVDQLVHKALAAGGRDNITAVLFRV